MVNIYIDESGSINNKLESDFVITLVRVLDEKKMNRAYKRFVAANLEELRKLDKKDEKHSGRMFNEVGKFRELKGSRFDQHMRDLFLTYFAEKPYFELYYIKIPNTKLTDYMCKNASYTFNFAIRNAMRYLIRNGYLPADENIALHLDERNEKKTSIHFLENYLNTELMMDGTTNGHFTVTYYDSAANSLVQIADVFSNLYYSLLQTGAYKKRFKQLEKQGILRYVYEFPE